MRILQLLHDRERGGVQVLADMIETGIAPHGVGFEPRICFAPGIARIRAKLRCALRAARTIWRGDFDALVAYQATASILVGASVGCADVGCASCTRPARRARRRR